MTHTPMRLRGIFRAALLVAVTVGVLGVAWTAAPPLIRAAGLNYDMSTKELRFERTVLVLRDLAIQWQLSCWVTSSEGAHEEFSPLYWGTAEVDRTVVYFRLPPDAKNVQDCIEKPESVMRLTIWPYLRNVIPTRPAIIVRTHREAVVE